mmetsp:Transcript_33773/g.60695  ORF Transcript_33773/g.60695 Transcript_33773/m.60695 type:complete len:235 (-) Transcript_33773:456-1160(-)
MQSQADEKAEGAVGKVLLVPRLENSHSLLAAASVQEEAGKEEVDLLCDLLVCWPVAFCQQANGLPQCFLSCGLATAAASAELGEGYPFLWVKFDVRALQQEAILQKLSGPVEVPHELGLVSQAGASTRSFGGHAQRLPGLASCDAFCQHGDRGQHCSLFVASDCCLAFRWFIRTVFRWPPGARQLVAGARRRVRPGNRPPRHPGDRTPRGWAIAPFLCSAPAWRLLVAAPPGAK